MSEIGFSFDRLATTTIKEQSDMIEGWQMIQEDKADQIDEG